MESSTEHTHLKLREHAEEAVEIYKSQKNGELAVRLCLPVTSEATPMVPTRLSEHEQNRENNNGHSSVNRNMPRKPQSYIKICKHPRKAGSERGGRSLGRY